ncbi:hypothetical protein [Rhodococcus sp. O3]|uniref:hypothetical protein n=1 Tax=Rhodococcus sp. O3 TaxID=3404919 RepID=UPI003B67EB9C
MSKNSRTAAAVVERENADEKTEDDVVTEDAATGDAATENPAIDKAVPGKDRGRIGLLAAVLVAVLAIVVAGVLGWKWNQADAVDDASAAALDAARQYAVVLTSVSADDLDANFEAVLDGATGNFKDMYAQSSEQLRQLLVDNQATAEGVVIEAGIKSATTSKVEVLLFVDQTVTNAVTPEPRLDRSRVVMTMELVDGRWLASDVVLP